ncbi:MAG: polysaccharide biosynthesis tyrosine autokinase [Verrucomicrobia bacterium]|nr:polysaccharide biosynthesis tyrosine autokinase [Verrucomicrobiota bacterium]
MDPEQSQPSGESRLHFLDYWRIIRVRKLVILTVFLLITLTTTLVTYWLPKTYMSSVRMDVKKDETMLSKLSGQPTMNVFDPFFVQTQFERIQSKDVLHKVIEDLRLQERWARRQNMPEPMKKTDTETLLKKRIDPRQVRNTSIIEIRVYSELKEEAAEIANKIADVYKSNRAKARDLQTTQGLNELRGQLASKSNEVVQAKIHLDQVRTNLNLDIITPETAAGTLTLEVETVRQLEVQFNNDSTKLVGKEKILAGLTNKSVAQLRSSIHIFVPDEILARLIATHTQAEQELAARKATLGVDNPDYKKAQSILDAVDRQVDARVKGNLEGMQNELESLRAQRDSLKVTLEAAKLRSREAARKSREYLDALDNHEKLKRVRDVIELKIFQEESDAKLYSPATVEITDPAEIMDRPVLPKIPLNIALGIIFGLLVGVGLAFFIEYLDTSVKTIDDIEHSLQSPVLGVIPQDVGFLGDEGPESPNSEAYRILRTNVLFSRKDQKLNALTVVSGGAGEGKSTTVLNLAVTFAQQGARVLLVDSDLRRPSLHRRLNLSNQVGLTNFLLKQSELKEVIQTTSVPGLDFLPSGKLPASAMSILNTQQMRDFIANVKSRYDYVFFDSPPIMGVSDASILISEVDVAIMVIQYRKYPQSMAIRARQMIEKYGHNLLGVVLNNINVSQDAGYYYYGGDYYGYYNKSSRDRATSESKPAAPQTDKNGHPPSATAPVDDAFNAERKKTKPAPEGPGLHSKY